MSQTNPHTESLFWSALAISSPEERARYLDQACGGDHQMRGWIEKLLAAYPKAESFLEAPAPSPVVTVAEVPVGERPDTVVGPYKLLELIGEGGMGTVWMAQQTAPVKRLVAVKLIKAGMDSKQVIARFEAERQALALMDHANIARVLDAGTTEAHGGPSVGLSRPYFVMELVKGVPITRYCDDHHLTPRQRLELFIPVCQAVQHAHQKGIIHRDLKPSNVLVALYDGQPVPKVIDFGVAKAAGQTLTDKTLVTGFGTLVGTLEYMSPEQAEINQLDIDTRSDIYSLGVLLYELLAGSPPFTRKESETGGVLEMLRVIREQEPTKPSAKLNKLSSRHAERDGYVGVHRCQPRHGAGQAHETSPRGAGLDCAEGPGERPQPPLRDRQRLRPGYPALPGRRAGAGLSALGGVSPPQVRAAAPGPGAGGEPGGPGPGRRRPRHGLGLVQAKANAVRAVQAQERAEQGFAKAEEAVEQYLKAVTDDPDLKHKHDLHALRKKLLEAAVPFYQWFTEQRPGEAALEGERGRAYGRLADVRNELGEKEAALNDYERMQATFAGLAAAFPTVPEYRQRLAGSHHNLGLLLTDLGQRPAAEQAYRRALDLYEQLAADFPTVPEYRQGLAGSQNSLGHLLTALGQGQAAEQAYRRALDIRKQLVADFPTVAEYRRELARSHNSLGSLLTAVRQWSAAEQAFRRALDIREQLVTDFPTMPEYRRELAMSHHNLGLMLHDPGQRPAAERAFRRALDIYEKLVADFPTVPDYRRELASCHNNLGGLLKDLRQWPAAEQAFRRALDLYEQLAANFPAVPEYRRELAGSYVNFGTLLQRQGEAKASLVWYAKAIALLEPLVRQEPRLVTERLYLRNAHGARAEALTRLGQHADAIKDWDRALAVNANRQMQLWLHLQRARSWARAGDHARAVAEANALAGAKEAAGDTVYDLACVCAVAAAAVPEDAPLHDQYAARAVELLRQAVAQRYKDAARLKKDQDLDALRDREDFRRLVAELEAKQEG
jgi:serine/threonine protein kinase